MKLRTLPAAIIGCFLPAAAAFAVYCGQFTTPAPPPSSGGAPIATQNCFWFVAASGGSDSNNGTSSSTPFATLEKMQSVMRTAQTLNAKVGCLKSGSGGTFNRTSLLTFTSADNDEVWQFDPASGTNTAVLSGGNTIDLFHLNGVSRLTINGIKMQNVLGHVIYSDGANPNFTLANSDMSFNTGSSACADGWPPLICLNNTPGAKIFNNYVHDTISMGIALYAYVAGDSQNGSRVEGNVCLRCAQAIADSGALYVNMNGTGGNGGAVTFKNNFVRDYGASSLTNDQVCIYFDDNTSNSTAQGNICGAPTSGAPSAAGANNSACWLNNHGTNNKFLNNICDLGGTSRLLVGEINDGGNSFTNNIVVMSFAGGWNTTCSGLNGFAFCDAAPQTISNNMYRNYGGGQEVTTGTSVGDASPIHVSSVNLGCSGYLYNLAANSQAFQAPVSFPAIAGGWGPPGFVIPTSTNHSCP